MPASASRSLFPTLRQGPLRRRIFRGVQLRRHIFRYVQLHRRLLRGASIRRRILRGVPIRRRLLRGIPFQRWILAAALSFSAACNEDETAPTTTIELLSLTEDQEVSGVVELRVDAAHADEVRYEVSGELLTIRRSPPFDYRWNTRNTENGIHTLRAVAVGTVNNAADGVTVIVNNVGLGAEAMVLLQPVQTTVELEDTLRFSALVLGLTSRAVDWIVLGGDEDGTVDSTGLYRAPAALPAPPKAALVARSRTNPEVSSAADISLISPRRPE